jgi:hypothetical protein
VSAVDLSCNCISFALFSLNLLLLLSDDEEPPASVMAASPLAQAEPIEPGLIPRVTRAAVKKISQTQARSTKRSKKAKETNVSLEAHTSAASSNSVSVVSPLIVFLSSTPCLTPSFLQTLVKKFLDLSTECLGYLQCSDGEISIPNHCFFSPFFLLLVLFLFILSFTDALTTANARVASLEAELQASQKAFDTATAAKAAAEKSHKAALKKAEKALSDARKDHAKREEAVVGRLQAISHAAGSKYLCLHFFDLYCS